MLPIKLVIIFLFIIIFNVAGVMTLLGAVEGLAYLNTKYNDDVKGRPDIEFIFASASIPNDNGLLLRKGIGITDEVYDKTYK